MVSPVVSRAASPVASMAASLVASPPVVAPLAGNHADPPMGPMAVEMKTLNAKA